MDRETVNCTKIQADPEGGIEVQFNWWRKGERERKDKMTEAVTYTTQEKRKREWGTLGKFGPRTLSPLGPG